MGRLLNRRRRDQLDRLRRSAVAGLAAAGSGPRRNVERLESRFMLDGVPSLPPELATAISDGQTLGTQLNSILNTGTGIAQDIQPFLNHDLPIVGQALDSGTNGAVTFMKNVQAAVVNAEANLATFASMYPNDPADQVAAAIQAELGSTVDSATQALGVDASNAVSGEFSKAATSTHATFYEGGTAANPNGTPAGAGDQANAVQFDVDLHGSYTVNSIRLDSSLGLPGLGITVASGSKLAITVDYAIYLHFGAVDVGGNVTWYVDTNPTRGDAGTDFITGKPLSSEAAAPPDVISMGVAIGLSPGFKATGTLGPLQLAVQDESGPTDPYSLITRTADPTSFTAGFGIGLGNAVASLGGSGTLGSLTPTVHLSGEAQVNLDGQLSISGNTEFPTIDAELHFDWKFGTPSAPTPVDGSDTLGTSFGTAAPTFDFDHVGVNIGTFLKGTVGKILGDLNTVFSPLSAITNVLNSPMPIFNDLKAGSFLPGLDQNGDGTVTVAEFFGWLTGNETVAQYASSIGEITSLFNVVTKLGTNGGFLDFGSLDLGSASFDPRTLLSAGSAAEGLTNLDPSNYSSVVSAGNLTSQFESLAGAAGLNSGQVNDLVGTGALSGSGMGAGSFTFPLLSNPASIFPLLLGQGSTTTLFSYQSPTIIATGFSLDQSFEIIGPLMGVIHGGLANDDVVDFQGRITCGYDAYGLSELLQNPTTDASQIASDLGDGFYVDTGTNADGKPNTYLGLDFALGIGAELSLLIVSAGVGGGIEGSIAVHPSSSTGDNKLRIGQIESDPSQLFNLTGEIDAYLDAFAKIGIGPFSKELDYHFLTLKLLSFNLGGDSADGRPPDNLGTVDANGRLDLQVGADAGTNTDLAKDVKVRVNSVSTTPDPNDPRVPFNTITVRASSGKASYTQTFSGVKEVYFNGGVGQNSLYIGRGVSAAVYAYGGGVEDPAAIPAPSSSFDPQTGQTVTDYVTPQDDIDDEGTGPFYIAGGKIANTIRIGSGTDDAPSWGGQIVEGPGNNMVNVTGVILPGQRTEYTVEGKAANAGMVSVLAFEGGNNSVSVGPEVYQAVLAGGAGTDVLDSQAIYTTLQGGDGDETFVRHDGILFLFEPPVYTINTEKPAGSNLNKLIIVGAPSTNAFTVAEASGTSATVTDAYQVGQAQYSDTITIPCGPSAFQVVDLEGDHPGDSYAIGDLYGLDLPYLATNLDEANGVNATDALTAAGKADASGSSLGTDATSDTVVTMTHAAAFFFSTQTPTFEDASTSGPVYQVETFVGLFPSGPYLYVPDEEDDTLTYNLAPGSNTVNLDSEPVNGDINNVAVTTAETGPLTFTCDAARSDLGTDTFDLAGTTGPTEIQQNGHNVNLYLGYSDGTLNEQSYLTDITAPVKVDDAVLQAAATPTTPAVYYGTVNITADDSLDQGDYATYAVTDTLTTATPITSSTPVTMAKYVYATAVTLYMGDRDLPSSNPSVHYDTYLGTFATVVAGTAGQPSSYPTAMTVYGSLFSDDISAQGSYYGVTIYGSVPGQSSIKGIDDNTIVGGDGNDVIYVGSGGGTNKYSSGSTIDGGGGTNTLTYTALVPPGYSDPPYLTVGTAGAGSLIPGALDIVAGVQEAAPVYNAGYETDVVNIESLVLNGGTAAAPFNLLPMPAGGPLRTIEVDAGAVRTLVAYSIPTQVTVATGNAGLFDLNGMNQSVGSISGVGTVSVTGATLTTNTAAPTTFNGTIAGAGSVTFGGAAALTLGGSNTYTGTTTVTGTLALAVANALPTATDLTVPAGGTVNLNGVGQTVGSLAGAGAVALGSGALTAGGDNASTAFAGTISGTGTVAKVGTGTLTLGGPDTFTGGLAVSAGTVTVGDGTTHGSLAANVALAGGTLQFNRADVYTYGGSITGTGTLAQAGSGTTQLAAPGQVGSTQVQSGTLRLLGGPSQTYVTGFAKSNNIYTTLNEQFPHTGTGTPGGGSGTPNAAFVFDPAPAAVAAAGYAPNYVAGSNLANNGITFQLTSDAAGHDYEEINSGTTLTVPVNQAGVTNAYLLMSAYNSQTVTVTFTAADGTTQVFNNVNLPDFNGGSINTSGTNYADQTVFQVHDVGGGGTGNSVTGATNNYDLSELGFTLLPTLVNQRLASISITSSGFEPVLFGVTVTQANVMPSAVNVASGATFDLNGLTASIGSIAGGGTVPLGSGQLTTGLDNTSTAFTGVISGTGSVVKAGTGAWTVSGVNTYTGPTAVNGGVENFNAAAALGAGTAVTLNGGTLQYAAGNTADLSARTVTVGAGGATIDTNGNNVTWADPVGGGGAGPFAKAGAGTLTLSAVGTWQGATAVNGGTLRAGVANVLPAGGDLTVAAAGTFDLNSLGQAVGSLAGGGAVTLGSATLMTGAGGNTNSTAFAGTIGGAGQLDKVGTGVLTLSGVNTYAGGTVIDERSTFSHTAGLSVLNDADLGAAGAPLTFVSDMNGSGVLYFTQSQTLTRPISINGNTNGFAGGSINVAAGTTLTDNAVISNVGTSQSVFTKNGGGTLVLDAVNTYGFAPILNSSATPTIINAGTVRLGVANALPDGTVTLGNNAVLDLNGFNQRLAGLDYGGFYTTPATVTNSRSTPVTLTLDGGIGFEYDGIITDSAASGGTLSLVVNGQQTLGGTASVTGSTYSGGTTVLAGTLGVTAQATSAAAGPLGSGPVTLGAPSGSASASILLNRGAIFNPVTVVAGSTGTATLDAVNTGNTYFSPITLQKDVTLGGAAFNQAITGPHNVTINNGAAAAPNSDQATSFPTPQPYGGSTTLAAGVLNLGVANALPTTTALTVSNSGYGNAVNLNGFGQTIGSLAESAGGDVNHGAVNMGSATLTIGTDNTSTTFGGVLTGTGGVAKVGTGTLTLAAGEAFTGPLAVNAGTVTIGDGSTNGSLAANVVLGGGTVAFARSDAVTYGGTITGTGALSQVGAGVLTVPVPTFAGTTTVQAGTLRLSAAEPTPVPAMPSAVVVGAGGTFDANGISTSVGSLAGAGSVTLGSAVLTVGTDNTSTTLAGVVSGTGGLAKVGTGTLTLTAADTYTGPTLVNAGALQLAIATQPALPTPAVLYTFNDAADTGTTVTNDGTAAGRNATLSNAAEVSGVAGAPGGGKVMAMTTSAGELLMTLVGGKGLDLSGGAWTAGLWFDGLYPSSSYRTAFHSQTTYDAQAIVQGGGYALGSYVNGFVGSPYNVDGSGTPATNVTAGWHQLVAVGSGGRTAFYIDGTLVGSINSESTTDLATFGNYQGTTGEPFAHYLADVDAYQVALTPAQIQALYLQQEGVTVAGSLAGTAVTVAAGAALNVNDTAGLSAGTALTSNGSTTFAANAGGTTILTRSLASVSIGPAGTVAVAPSATAAGRTLLAVGSLAFAGAYNSWAGQLDLANNDLDVANGNLANLTNLVAGGFAGGRWTGPGIVSSAAGANAAHLTTVAVFANVGADGVTPLYASFDGRPASATDVLVKYTLFGDLNGDGVVNAADYTRIDAGFVNHLTGFANGDLNYDGVVDGTDYALMDNAFNQQTQPAAPAAAVAAPAAAAVARVTARPAAVPASRVVSRAAAPTRTTHRELRLAVDTADAPLPSFLASRTTSAASAAGPDPAFADGSRIGTADDLMDWAAADGTAQWRRHRGRTRSSSEPVGPAFPLDVATTGRTLPGPATAATRPIRTNSRSLHPADNK